VYLDGGFAGKPATKRLDDERSEAVVAQQDVADADDRNA
jgi:hypothetical protein